MACSKYAIVVLCADLRNKEAEEIPNIFGLSKELSGFGVTLSELKDR